MLKEYGVTSPATAECHLCDSLGNKTEMTGILDMNGNKCWFHNTCVLAEAAKRKEE